jgi:hypothetical protein
VSVRCHGSTRPDIELPGRGSLVETGREATLLRVQWTEEDVTA